MLRADLLQMPQRVYDSSPNGSENGLQGDLGLRLSGDERVGELGNQHERAPSRAGERRDVDERRSCSGAVASGDDQLTQRGARLDEPMKLSGLAQPASRIREHPRDMRCGLQHHTLGGPLQGSAVHDDERMRELAPEDVEGAVEPLALSIRANTESACDHAQFESAV